MNPDMEELMGEVDELRDAARLVDDSLECAECSEKVSDVFLNVNDALDEAKKLVNLLTEFLAKEIK